jgi:hypothetical protein
VSGGTRQPVRSLCSTWWRRITARSFNRPCLILDKLAFCILGIAQGTCRLDGSHQIWQYVMRGEIKINASHQATLTLYQMACLASLVRSRWDGMHIPVTCSSNRTRRGPSRPGRLLLSTLRRASLSSGGTTCTVLADCCIGPGLAGGAT